MSLNLITAPSGAGKTQYVIEQIRAHAASKPLSRVMIIVPSGTQLIALRERLGAQSHATLGVTVIDFYSLYHDILDAAGTPPRLLPEAARYRVVRTLGRRLTQANQIPHFAPIAAKPGFITAVSAFIADLKESFTLPEIFAGLASTPRTRDLAAIYSAYQDFLQSRDLADRQGMGWIARLTLEADPRLCADFDYISADGFDEFNPTQLALLNALAERVPRLDVTLTYQPNRLAHVRTTRTFEQFRHATHVQLDVTTPPRAEPLQHLERNLFELNAPCVSTHGEITVIAAPDRAREVRAVAREVKRLLVGDVRAEQVGVLFRRLHDYQPIVREVFAEFGIPFRVRDGMVLKSNPLIAALLNLLSLGVRDFSWRDTLDALRSPYFQLRDMTTEHVTHIEHIVREAVVVKGRGAWLAAFAKPVAPLREDDEDRRLVAQLSAEEIEGMRMQVERLFGRITPSARASVRDYAAFIEGLIGPDPHDEAWRREQRPEQVQDDLTSLRVVECTRNASAELAARDLAALVEFKNVLRGLIEAAEVLNEGQCGWDEYLADLDDALSAATYDLTPTTEGRVVIATITQARGVPKDFIFVGGLVESEFPVRAPEDPLLSLAESNALREAGLTLRSLQTGEETTLFYEAATLARTRLYLAYPYLDDDANPLYSSPYIESVTRLFHQVQRIRHFMNDVPPLRDAASLSELAVSLVRASRSARANNEDATATAHALRRVSPAWNHSLFARQVETKRESSAACDEHSGVMRDVTLRAEFAQRFGPHHLWSASQFNDWGACGFRFFARRVLLLAELAEPEEGFDARQLGSIYHQILEQTYRAFGERRLALSAQTLTEAEAILQATATRLLDDAPRRFAFRPTAWWQQERDEIIRRLRALLAAEAERHGASAPMSVQCETPFGFTGAPPVSIALPIGSIRVAGTIDRMDEDAEGMVLVDYKSSSTRIGAREVMDGRNLQLPVYVLAAEALGYEVADAFFLHIRNGETSGDFARVDRESWLAAAQAHLAQFVNEARRGAFAVQPRRLDSGACLSYCEFASLCRVGRWSSNKTREEAHA